MDQHEYPVVPGHEIVGRVTKVGAQVTSSKEGDLAAVGCMVDSCRTCAACKAGLEQYCEGPATFTYNSEDKHLGGMTYGGYSQSIVVDEDFVLRVRRTWILRPRRRCFARASPPILRCGTGRSAKARRSASSVWAVWATWA